MALIALGGLVVILLLTVNPSGRASAQTNTLSVDTTRQLTEGGTFQGFGINDNAGRLWSQGNALQGANLPSDYTNNVGPRLAALHPAYARELVDLTWFAYNQTGSTKYDDATLATDSSVQNGFTYGPASNAWKQNSPTGAYFSSTHLSSEPGDTASIPCTSCTGFQYFAITGPDEGIASVQVDGGTAVDVDLYSPTKSSSTLVYATPTLPAGPHTLTITVTGTENASSTGDAIDVDAISELGEPGIAYTWDSAFMQGFITDLENLQSVGAQVILTISQISPWMTGTPSDVRLGTGADGKPAANFPLPTTDQTHMNDWTTAIVALLDHLTSLGINSVSAIGAPNELADVDSVSNLNAGFASLRSALDAAGYSNVQLFGPDMYNDPTPQDVIAAENDVQLNPLLNFYDWHAYYGSTSNLNLFPPQQRSLSKSAHKPIWITEFGVKTGGNNIWTQLPTFMIDGLNKGASAISVWDFVDFVFGGIPSQSNKPSTLWGLIGPAPSYTPKTSYYVYSDVTAHTAAGSQVFPVTCSGTCSGIEVAALRDGAGQDAVLLYNASGTQWTGNITFNGAPVTETLYKYQINPAHLPPTTPPGQLLPYSKSYTPSSSSTYSISVTPQSFAVFSAINPISP